MTKPAHRFSMAERLRANIATSQAAYAEASKRVDHSLAPARPSLAQALKQRRKLRGQSSQRG
jgi:hypothetical protein